jgi:hypothetical protein
VPPSMAARASAPRMTGASALAGWVEFERLGLIMGGVLARATIASVTGCMSTDGARLDHVATARWIGDFAATTTSAP